MEIFSAKNQPLMLIVNQSEDQYLAENSLNIQQYTHKLQHPNIATYSEITTFSHNQIKLQLYSEVATFYYQRMCFNQWVYCCTTKKIDSQSKKNVHTHESSKKQSRKCANMQSSNITFPIFFRCRLQQYNSYLGKFEKISLQQFYN